MIIIVATKEDEVMTCRKSSPRKAQRLAGELKASGWYVQIQNGQKKPKDKKGKTYENSD